MEKKRGKRTKPVEDGLWDCSVCTYKNSAEAFKCAMCDVRKGTSTRKPKPNPQLVAQQVAQQLAPPPPKREKHPIKRPDKVDLGSDTSQDSHRSETKETLANDTKQTQPRHTKSSDQGSSSSAAISMEVTVGDLTVVITDYKPKTKRKRLSTESQNSRESSIHTDNTSSPELTSSTSRVLD